MAGEAAPFVPYSFELAEVPALPPAPIVTDILSPAFKTA
jgi:hypothetical protein